MKHLLHELATVFLTLSAFALPACSDFPIDPGEARVVEKASSPSGSFEAYHWTWAGGGAAGLCSRRISVVPNGEELPLLTEPEKARIPIVFSTRCSSRIILNWTEDTHLRISHSLGDDPFPTSLSQASRTENGRVRISYEIVEK